MMRLFSVDDQDRLVEYKTQKFGNRHLEETLESWLEANPDAVLEDSKLLVIGRQVSTNLGTFIDLLGLDREGNVVVVELKRERTPRDTLAQALEYASFAADLEYEQLQQIFRAYGVDDSVELSEYHRAFFDFEDSGIAFNKEQRVVLIGEDISAEIIQTSKYLRRRGLRVTCVAFSYFRSESGEQLLTTDLVVGREPAGSASVTTGSLPRIDRETFLKNCDENGRSAFTTILDFANNNNLPRHWGSKGFSLNADVNGIHVPLCYGYPSNSVYKQSIYTAFADVARKVEGGEELTNACRDAWRAAGHFVNAGNEVKLLIDRGVESSVVEALTSLLLDLAGQIRHRGVRET